MNSRLSHRLQSIYQHTPKSLHIYDVGCDHGDLGLTFMDDPKIQTITLVDPSSDVIEELNKKITVSDIPKGISILKKRADQLKIETKENSVIMCGFGGSQIAQGVEHLAPQMDEHSYFVLSPHGHYLQLREFLSTGNFHLVLDAMLIEDGQFYPLIIVGNHQGRGVHPFGEKDLWHSPEGLQYRMHLLKVYKSHQNPRDQRFYKYLETL